MHLVSMCKHVQILLADEILEMFLNESELTNFLVLRSAI